MLFTSSHSNIRNQSRLNRKSAGTIHISYIGCAHILPRQHFINFGEVRLEIGFTFFALFLSTGFSPSSCSKQWERLNGLRVTLN